MKLKIGFILSRPFVPFLNELLPNVEIYCEITQLVADHNSEVEHLYKIHVNEMDCFIFSGSIFYHALTDKVGFPAKPCYVIDDFEGNLNDIFLRLLLNDRQVDFKRVFIDIACSFNDYLGLKTFLKKSDWPYFNRIDDKYIEIEELTNKTLAQHIKLHEEGKIDLSITRFGTMVKILDDLGYKVVYMYPPKEYLFNFIMQIVSSFHRKQTQSQLSGAIVINIRNVSAERREVITSELNAYFMNLAQLNGCDFMFQINCEKIEILTLHRDLEILTKGFTDSAALKAPIDQYEEEIIIGIGTGKNIYSAKVNAYKAIDYSNNSSDLYFVNEENILLGPIGADDSISMDSIPSDRLQYFSNKFHVDHMNLQKIVAFTKLKDTTKITGSELADYLKITLRSANRLINRIEENGGAKCYTEKLGEGRGRPKRYCEMIFIKEL